MKYMLSEIARICGGELIGEDLPVARVLTDSRNCSFGEEPLFVAMKGTNHDSHAFIGEMVRRDVKAFLAERKTQLPAGCGCVVVPSAIAALQQLGPSPDSVQGARGRYHGFEREDRGQGMDRPADSCRRQIFPVAEKL